MGQAQSIKTVAVLFKAGSEQARGTAWTVADWLTARGLTVLVRENVAGAAPVVLPDRAAPPPKPELTVVLGGDGTMLSAARQAAAEQVPLFGINLGRVGFMTEACLEDWQDRLAVILRGEGAVIRRILLDITVLRGAKPVFTTTAVNDAVVSRGAMARLASFEVRLGETDICTLRADGVVVTTPTGSTAYCVSAGGPLIHPDLDVLCVVPICPFLSDFTPVVVPSSATVRLSLCAPETTMYLTCDGQELFPLNDCDVVVIRRAERMFQLARSRGDGYFEKLRRKGFINRP